MMLLRDFFFARGLLEPISSRSTAFIAPTNTRSATKNVHVVDGPVQLERNQVVVGDLLVGKKHSSSSIEYTERNVVAATCIDDAGTASLMRLKSNLPSPSGRRVIFNRDTSRRHQYLPQQA